METFLLESGLVKVGGGFLFFKIRKTLFLAVKLTAEKQVFLGAAYKKENRSALGMLWSWAIQLLHHD